jgi:hypothetical protein
MLWLERKYLSMVVSSLDRASWKGDNTLNHRCLYCGDSQKNLYKARAYHFTVDQSFVYKCHNCGKSTSSVNFIKDHFPTVHKEYVKEWLKETGRGKRRPQKMLSANAFKFKSKVDQQDVLYKSMETLKAVCHGAWDKVVAREYLQERLIPDEIIKALWFVSNSQSLSLLNRKYRDRVLGSDPRIVLPFFDENGELAGVSGRAINDSPLRYLTMRFLDDVPLIYNVRNVDKSKTVYVTEGPIDSLFLPNSIAVGGSDFKKLDNSFKENAILIYDNEPRSSEILKKIDEVIDQGWQVCIWNDKRVSNFKDINDMVKGGLEVDEIIDIINSCTYTGLSAKLTLMEYKKI